MVYQSNYMQCVLLLISRMIRSFSIGIFSFIFFECLLSKDLTLQSICNLQIIMSISHVLVSYIVKLNVLKIGRIRSLLILTVLRGLSGFILAEFSDFEIVSISSCICIISMFGEQTCPFVFIEKSILATLAKKQQYSLSSTLHLEGLINWYNIIGHIFRGFGCITSGLFYFYGSRNFQNTNQEISQTLLRMYSSLALGTFVIYGLIDRQKCCDNSAKKNEIEHLAISLDAKCPRFIDVTLSILLVAINTSAQVLVSQPLITYFFVAKHHTHYNLIGVILMGTNILRALGYVLFKVCLSHHIIISAVTHLEPCLLMICFGYFQDSVTISFVIFLVYSFLSSLPQSNKHTFLCETNHLKGHSSIIGLIGFIIGILCGIKMLYNSLILKQYGFPFCLGGILRLVFKLITFFVLWRRKTIMEKANSMNIHEEEGLFSTETTSQ